MAEANKATSARRGLTIASSAEVLHQINIENAKFVAILLLSGMLIFHGVLKITTGNLLLLLLLLNIFSLSKSVFGLIVDSRFRYLPVAADARKIPGREYLAAVWMYASQIFSDVRQLLYN